MMEAAVTSPSLYARAIENSKRVRWEIDRDVFRGRRLDFAKKFLPDGLSRVHAIGFLDEPERVLLSQIQGRTYANMFALVERYIGAKMLDLSRDHALGDQVALEALVRATDEELKHQEMFRRLEEMMAEGMPAGYHFMPDPNEVALVVLSKSPWAVLGLTCHIEIFTLVHYRQSIETAQLSEVWKDVFLFHFKEESQHALIDEVEWARENAILGPYQKDAAVTDLIDLVGAVDGILVAQAQADAKYFVKVRGRATREGEQYALEQAILRAYRWQYIGCGVQEPRFTRLLHGMITPEQGQRIATALTPILQ